MLFGFEKCWQSQNHRGIDYLFKLQEEEDIVCKSKLLMDLDSIFKPAHRLWNFKPDRKLFMPVLWQYVQWFLCPKHFFDSLTFHIFLVLFQLLLTNPRNILKFGIWAKKTEDHQLKKMVLQIHVLRLLCCWHSLHIWKSFIHNQTKYCCYSWACW